MIPTWEYSSWENSEGEYLVRRNILHQLLPTTKKIVRSGIVAAIDFPPAIQCPKVIMECAKYYDAERRVILAPDGKLLANLTTEAISEAFGFLHSNP